MEGRGEVQKQPEGGTEGGEAVRGKGNEGVSKIVPANTDSLRAQLRLKKAGMFGAKREADTSSG